MGYTFGARVGKTDADKPVPLELERPIPFNTLIVRIWRLANRVTFPTSSFVTFAGKALELVLDNTES